MIKVANKVFAVFLGFNLCICGVSAAPETEASCFLVKENGTVLKSEGECNRSYSPASSFKIALSLMGFDSGILKKTDSPSWLPSAGAGISHNVCKGKHNPLTWMRDSCIWYSQLITERLGMEKFQRYVDQFSYGNRDLSGDKGKNNGLTRAWLSSSLAISPEGQIEFLQKFVDKKLSVKESSYKKTKKIIYLQELAGGWKLYGKTGVAIQLDSECNRLDIRHGWFVGFIEKKGRTIIFASHIVDKETASISPALRAKNETLIQLWYLINDLEK